LLNEDFGAWRVRLSSHVLGLEPFMPDRFQCYEGQWPECGRVRGELAAMASVGEVRQSGVEGAWPPTEVKRGPLNEMACASALRRFLLSS